MLCVNLAKKKLLRSHIVFIKLAAQITTGKRINHIITGHNLMLKTGSSLFAKIGLKKQRTELYLSHGGVKRNRRKWL